MARGKTIDQLKTEGAKALTNEQLQTYVVGKTIKVRNTVTGQTFEIVYAPTASVRSPVSTANHHRKVNI